MSPYSVFCHAYLPISHLAPLNWLNIMPLCPFLCVSVKSPLDSIPEPSFTSHFCWIFKPLWKLCLLQAGTACTLRQIGCPLRPVQRNWERTAVAFLLHSAAPASFCHSLHVWHWGQHRATDSQLSTGPVHPWVTRTPSIGFCFVF